MYTVENFKSKKALKEAFTSGKKVKVFQPGLSQYAHHNGQVYLEGPHYPAPHKWYAVVDIEDDMIVRILK